MISTSTQLDVDHLLTPSEVIGSFEEETDETIPQNIDYRQSDKPYSSMPSRKHIWGKGKSSTQKWVGNMLVPGG